MDWLRPLICVENDCMAFALKLIVLWIQFVALGIDFAHVKLDSAWLFSLRFLVFFFLNNSYFWNMNLDSLVSFCF